jgi:Cu+-exporting ATPase
VVPGRGVRAQVDGRDTVFGGAAWLDELVIDRSALAAPAEALQASGHSVSWLAQATAGGASVAANAGPDAGPDAGPIAAPDADPPRGWQVQGVIAFADAPKPTARAAVAALKAQGIVTTMLSGDNAGAAARVAAELGLEQFEANVLPQDKAARVTALKAGPHGKRRVAMVGDGINDAPALAAADLGIAMGTGTDIAMHAAGVTLMRGDPLLVAEAIALSRATVRKIRQNLFWAFIYNVVGIPLAAFGLLSPVVAGAAMAFSSVSVITNSLLLKRTRLR